MSAASKILRTANAPKTAPDATELLVAQALVDLEAGELKADLRPLQISAAREVDVKGGKKAIVIFVPVPQIKAFHKIQGRLTRELEKKFSDRHVVFIGQRRMMRKPTRVSRVKQQRPRSRTLKEVHEKILEDLVFPTVRSTSLLRAERLMVWSEMVVVGEVYDVESDGGGGRSRPATTSWISAPKPSAEVSERAGSQLWPR
ncbi:ribosomal protein S7e-domain-containing protein [Leucosporidium creatinivorum]|uniref:40S ribosomal protein S7 n=1 Tax=Leucosporidium creatinivorum TaxID=106004 RepID=A0A1Y2F2R3_9BASI|nr:ribosomal protein S7e-domain-containing protein [Leucosporidium creatinivorum]